MKPCKKCGKTERGKPNKDSAFGKCLNCARIYYAQYYEKNKEALLSRPAAKRPPRTEYNSKYRIANLEKLRAKDAAYYLANREKKRISGQNRRSRKKYNGGKLSFGLAEKLLKLQKNKCACCRKSLVKYHLDHIVPLALGGKHSDENIQLLCPTCNLQKQDKHPINFMQEKGFLL